MNQQQENTSYFKRILFLKGRNCLSFFCFHAIVIHIFMVAWMSIWNSPNGNEPGHLAAGVYTLRFGRNDLYRVNPPLTRMVAAIPATYFYQIDADWLSTATNILSYRPEYEVGTSLYFKNDPEKLRDAFIWGRLFLLPLSFLGAWTCFQFAKELFGTWCGFFALLFWCFNPYILTWSATINPDITATSVGIFSFYFFWKWCNNTSWANTGILGVITGCLLVTKTVWIIIFALWPVILLIHCFMSIPKHERHFFHRAGKLITIFTLALLVVNVFYNFSGSFKKLNDYIFISQTLTGGSNEVSAKNRFTDSLLGVVPVPLPQDYVYGIDVQKYDFERGIPSFINGHWSEHGYWYYYFYAFFLKTPIGFQILIIITIFLFLIKNKFRLSYFNEIILLLPLCTILALISTQDGFSVHSRYLLPFLPFLFIWVSRIGLVFVRNDSPPFFFLRLPKGAIVLLTGWMLASVILVFPHCMSYFNEWAGGPHKGGKYLLGSDLDWGQDVYYLEKWQKQNFDARPLRISLSWTMPLENTRIKYDGIVPKEGDKTNIYAALRPGWYAINVNNIFNQKNEYAFLRYEVPVARAGYSIYIYHFDKNQIDDLRTKNHLPLLDEESKRLHHFASELLRKKDDIGNQRIRIAIYNDKGVTEGSKSAIENVLKDKDFVCEAIDVDQILNGNLGNYDVFIVPGGISNNMAEKIGGRGKEAIRNFIQSGGGYVGVCAGAFLASATFDRFLGLVNVKSNHSQEMSPRLGMLEQRQLGGGEVELEFSSEGRKLFAQPSKGCLSYINGPIFMEAGVNDLPDFLTLATYNSDIYQHHFQQGTMPKTPAIVAGRFGKGSVILFSPHPELTEGMESLLTDAVRAVRKSRESEDANRMRREMGLPEIENETAHD